MEQEQEPPSEEQNQSSEYNILLDEVRLLLRYLQRTNDDRLMLHFEDARPPDVADPRARPAPGNPAPGVPPCKSYADFLMRLGRMKPGQLSAEVSGDPKLDDAAFLRWSLDFLAGLVFPATAETIALTEAYIDARARWANDSWWQWLVRVWFWWVATSKSPARPESKYSKRLRQRAVWLAKSLSWLEFIAISFGTLTVALSAYAMVGRLIISDEARALTAFTTVTQAIDRDRHALTLADNVGLSGTLAFLGSSAHPKGEPDAACPPSFDWTPIERALDTLVVATNRAQSRDPDPLTPAEDLVRQCGRWQWRLTALINDNLMLHGWEYAFLWLPGFKGLVGWDADAIEKLGNKGLTPDLCRRIANAYWHIPAPGCGDLLVQVALDSSSLPNSILQLVAQSILPCLYALIGAAAATMLYLRRQVDRSLLSYTDRGRIKYNLILGFVFGAVIALIADFIPGTSETAAQPAGLNGLGLSALALLAGYNVSGVFRFLDAVSRRLFDIPEHQTPATRAAQR